MFNNNYTQTTDMGMGAKAKKNDDGKLRLSIDNPPKFKSLIQTNYTDSLAFCEEMINPLFRSLFVDFFGSKIEISANNRNIITSLFFAENPGAMPEGRIQGIEKLVNPDNIKKDIGMQIKMINNSFSVDRYQNQFKLTEDAMSLLEDLVPNAAKQSGKIQWKMVTTSGAASNAFLYPGMEPKPFLRVFIDINKLVNKIYGSYDKDQRSRCVYQVMVGNPINPMSTYGGNLIAKHWQLFIQKLSTEVAEQIVRASGIGGQNDMGIII